MFIMLVSEILGTKPWVGHDQYWSRKHQRRNQRLIGKGFAMHHLMRQQGVQCDDPPPKKGSDLMSAKHTMLNKL